MRWSNFGIYERTVRERLFLIIRPPAYDETTKLGVYPEQERNGLRWSTPGNDAGELPTNDWAEKFRENLPGKIVEALKRARPKSAPGEIEEKIRKRVALYAERWRNSPLLLPHQDGDKTSEEPLIPGKRERNPDPEPHPEPEQGPPHVSRQRPANEGKTVFARPGKPVMAKETQHETIDTPEFEWVDSAEELDLDDTFVMARYERPNSTTIPAGKIFARRDHPAFVQIVRCFQDDWDGVEADEMRKIVEQSYETFYKCMVGHTIRAQRVMGKADDEIFTQYLSPQALTTAIHGFFPHDAVIAQEVPNRGRRPRRVA
jgi:hypothetical protein